MINKKISRRSLVKSTATATAVIGVGMSMGMSASASGCPIDLWPGCARAIRLQRIG